MNRFIFTMLLGLALVFNGCGIEEPETPEQPVVEKEDPVLKVDTRNINVPYSGGIYSVTITSNYEFEITMPDDASEWIESKVQNSGKIMLSLIISINDGYDDRTAQIHIKQKEHDLSETVTVIQKQKDALFISQSDYVLTHKAGSFAVPVLTNAPFEVTISEGWLKRVESKALVESEVVFSYEGNDDINGRTAEIVFKSPKDRVVVSVMQKPVVNEYRLGITHSSECFYVPSFSGMVYSGTVIWGDGSEDDYAEGIWHEYSNVGEVRTELVIESDKDEHVLQFKDIKGISEIDLSGM